MKQAINYEALERAPTNQELKDFTQAYAKYVQPTLLSPLALATFFSIFLSLFFTGFFIQIFVLAGWSLYIVPIFTTGMFFGLRNLMIRTAHTNQVSIACLYTFAKVNGLTLELEQNDTIETGMIFNIGKIGNYSISLKGDGFRIGNYDYSDGTHEGKHGSWAFIAVELSSTLPHIVLDGRANNMNFFGSNLSNLPKYYMNDQVLSLEGDFDKYFTLYAPEDYKSDALYIFTPDLMAQLIDVSAPFDAEIVGNKLYFYQEGAFNLSKRATMEQIMTIINTVGVHTINRTSKYMDGRPESPAMKSDVPPAGKVLKHGSPPVIGVVIVILFSITMILSFVNAIRR